MATLLIFEDGDNTPSSLLLKSSFNGSNIHFSNGCGKLARKIARLYNGIDNLYVFYDVSPNNAMTTQGYSDLKQLIITNAWRNVTLLPIVCIEQIIAVMLDKYEYLTKQNKDNEDILNCLVRNFEWDKLSENIKKNSSGIEESLEHIYKRFISNQKMQCIHNGFKYDKSDNRNLQAITGIFYEKDCNCDRKYCNINSTSLLQEKAERLYTELPMFTIISEVHRKLIESYGIMVAEKKVADIKKKQQDYYNYICKKMHRLSIQV